MGEEDGTVRIALLGDTHVGHPGAWERLQVVGAWLAKGGADQAVVMGDVVHTAAQREYEEAKAFFMALPLTVRLTTGNHELFCRELPIERRIARFERYLQPVPASWSLAGVRFILLAVDQEDPQLPETRRDTVMTPTQLAWFERVLGEHPQEPTIVMSHAPLTGTVEASELYPMADSEALWAIARQHPQIRLWASAHTHLPDCHLGRPLRTQVQQDGILFVHCLPIANYYVFKAHGEPVTYPLQKLEVRCIELLPGRLVIETANPVSGERHPMSELVLS